MKRHFLKWGSRVLIALALCAGVSSCSKDDDDDNTTPQKENGNGENNGGGNNGGENGGNGENGGGNAVGTDPYAASGEVNGHDYVDLGLKSGTLWATMNVGAESIEFGGTFIQWGSIDPNENKTWDTYWCHYYWETPASLKKDGVLGEDGALVPGRDYANLQWGSDWRTPTAEEISELVDNCTFTAESVNGKSGWRAQGPNGKCIFLPLGGYSPINYTDDEDFDPSGGSGFYWSANASFPVSVVDDKQKFSSPCMDMWPEKAPRLTTAIRESGCNIRPVRKK